jgi:hypothetical protein
MKYQNLSVIILLFSSFVMAQGNVSEGTKLENKFISKAASYFCYGNRNFLPCINDRVELESESCMAYVISNSKSCAEKHIYGAALSNPSAVESIGVAYTQCAMLEMLEVEGRTYNEFEQCFNNNYSASNVDKKLNK